MRNVFVFLFMALLVPLFVFAQEAAQAVAAVPVEPQIDELMKFFASIGGLKGASAMAIAVVVVQGLLLFFRSALARFAGIYQLLIVNGLTLIAGILGLKMSGVDWASAILHSQTLAALQVFANQIWKQYQKKDEKK